MDRIDQITTELNTLSANSLRRIDEQLDVSDCALSSWADTITRCKLEHERELLEGDGMACFLALVTLNGASVNARMIDGQYGTCWALCDDYGRITGTFLPLCDSADDCEPGTPYRAKDKKLQKRGYRQVAVLRPAIAKVIGYGHGLSGYARACKADPITGQGSCAWLPSEVK